MKVNVLLGIVIFCALITLAVFDYLSIYINTPSFNFVAGVAFCFSVSSTGTLFSYARLEAAAEGAVLAGWLGALIGAVRIAGDINGHMEALGAAIATALLPIIYGYIFKAVARMIILSRHDG